MKQINNYETIQANSGEFEKPKAGGYICVIRSAQDVPMDVNSGKGDYLKIEYDIAEGNLKGYYKEAYEKFGTWWASFIRSYKEKALGMFKHFTNCVEKSNPNYVWDWNEKGLEGKKIGIVLGEEEYIKNDGSVGTRMYVNTVKSVDDIKNGNYIVPKLKCVPVNNATSENTTGFVELPPVEDDDLPF